MREPHDDLCGWLPTGIIFTPGGVSVNMRRTLLDAVLRTCAYHHYQRDVRPVIKCNASSLLWMSEMCQVWPDAPFVVLIRNPVEVMVSNILRPAGWMRARHVSLDSRSLFGWNGGNVQQMSQEEYAARGLAAFFEAARHQCDARCTLIDYEDRNPESIASLAKAVGIQLPPLDSDEYLRVFKTYAKDVHRSAEYKDDREEKAQQADEWMRSAAARWAYGPYYALRTGAPIAGAQEGASVVVH